MESRTSTKPSVAYRGDGHTTVFPLTFPIFADGEVEVWFDDARQSTGFGVSGGMGGGTVTFLRPPPVGVIITLRRSVEVGQELPFDPRAAVSAQALNRELAKLGAAIEQVSDDLGRAVMRSPVADASVDLTLPSPVPGRALAWNRDGTGLANSGGNIEDMERQAAAHAAESGAWAERSSASAATASRAAGEAKAAEAGIRVVADAASRTIAAAADLSMVQARKAESLVEGVGDPAAAYRKQKLLGLW